MGFKKYVISTIVLLGLIGAYLNSLNLGEYTVSIDTQIDGYVLNQTLPIFVWILLPAVLLFVFSLLHMSYYGTKGYFVKQALIHDINLVESYIEDRIINEKSNKKFKTPQSQKLSVLLNQLEINPLNDEINIENKKLKSLIEKVSKINNNEYISLKSLKLKDDNILTKQNLKNRINKDNNFAFEVLKTPSKYNDEIIELAYNNILSNKSLDKIKSVLDKLTLNRDMLRKLLLKDSLSDAENRFTNIEILSFLNETKLDNKDLIEIAKNYKKTMQPEQLIKLFEDLSANNEKLTESYLYVLFEYEMLEQIKEILVNSQKDEFTAFKALMDLKDAGKHYSLESLSL